MDKKLILYLLILAGLSYRDRDFSEILQESPKMAPASRTTKLNCLSIPADSISTLTKAHSFLSTRKAPSSLPEQLGDGEKPSPELTAAYNKFLGESDGGSPLITFALFIGTGIFVGFLVVSYVLPSIVQKASEEVYGSTEKVGGPSPLNQAQANVAQGEWDQAIASYQQAAIEDPSNRLPWVEIAMLQRERLEKPELALETLDKALARGDWRENDEAFFFFRKIEIHENDLDQRSQAVALLREVMEKFPETRHYANAMHKLHEMGES